MTLTALLHLAGPVRALGGQDDASRDEREQRNLLDGPNLGSPDADHKATVRAARTRISRTLASRTTVLMPSKLRLVLAVR